ncbi:DUF1152 domain-containing protein [Nonomuraea sp. NPDC050663]|uniref:DUF1152 domain-containing protein n=1 Tax=Nonomuraea sp. NPDC050663 TaxID=3364370 RepID=UPI00378C8BA2
MFSLPEPPLFTRLRDARHVLIAGAGGGFDVFAGLPLAVALWGQGRRVTLANLSFSAIDEPTVVTPATVARSWYFPELSLSRWLDSQGLPSTVHAFPKVGVRPLSAAYRALVERLGVDAVVLVDGGTDILMRGDEAGLGTPEEDMASLAAVHGLDVPSKTVVCLGFGVDAFHGVNHTQVLENLAALEREGAYLGALSIPRDSREGAAYLAAVERAQADTAARPSIVNGSIAAALRGGFGDVRFTDRTGELFVNPLMSVYFAVDATALARRSLYLERLAVTETMLQISAVIEAFRREIVPRAPRAFPH